MHCGHSFFDVGSVAGGVYAAFGVDGADSFEVLTDSFGVDIADSV